MRRTIVALAAVFALLAPGLAHAVITNVDHADDVCTSSANPCVVNQTVEVVTGSTLNFGARTLQLTGNGEFDIKNGSVTIRAGRLLVNVGATAFNLVGPSIFGGDDGGLLVIEILKRCSSNTAIGCLRNSTCTAQSAGTCSVGIADVSMNGKIVGSADTPGTLLLRAAGDINILGAMQFNGQTPDSDGGSIEIESASNVTINNTLTATAGGLSGGGDIEILADLDATVNFPIDVTGGDFDGGIVEIEGRRDVIMMEDITASSNAGGGFGGEITIDAGRDVKLLGGTGSNRMLFAADGHTSFDAFAGDGGTHEYYAQRDVIVGQFARLTSDGSPPDGYGDFIFITANEDAVISGQIRANPRGDDGGGGSVEVLAFGNVHVTSTGEFDVSGSGAGAGDVTVSAIGQLDFDGIAVATATNEGTAGSVEIEGGDRLFLRGDLTIGGEKIRTFVGTVDVDACRIDLLSGALIDNDADTGITRFTARERATLGAGSVVRATGPGGINRITYRTPAKPPIIQGTVTPAPELVVNSALAPCPLCGNNELDGGETCEDGNRNNGDGCSSDCQDEGCVAATPGYPSVALCADGDACTVDTCNTTLHTCTHVSSCDDGIACTQDSCQGAACIHTPNDALCDDGNPCADGVCSTSTGCTAVPRSGPCNDNLFCNGSDSCNAGACSAHTGDPCLGGPECRDNCDEVRNSCIALSGTPCASDGNQCTTDECNSTGQCIHALNNGPCDDGIFCNGDDVCSGNTCSLHLGNPCVDAGECQDTCDESNDACQSPPGTPCTDDHNVCTADQCTAGGCAHDPRATFTAQRLTVTRIGGASNDRAAIKAVFPRAALTTRPSDTGFQLDVLDANAAVIYTATVPASAIVDSGGTGKVFKFSDKTGAFPQANGLTSAQFKIDSKGGRVRVKMRMANHDIPGVVSTPRVALSVLFGQSGASDDCVTDTFAPCTPRGTKVICGD